MDRISVLDMHTGGEPVRIVTGGYPPVEGATILDKRAFARDRLDHLRHLLIFEPRGHTDMYGALLVEPTLPGADLAVLFMHNEGYSTMCGHAVVALGRYAVDQGLVAPVEPLTRVGIEAPCGLVVAHVEVTGGRSGAVTFESVPSFLFARDLAVELPGVGTVVGDVAYGGAFYMIADCRQFGLAFGESRIRDFVDAGTALSEAVRRTVSVSHPDHDDLGFLYGSILTDGGDGFDRPSRNVCIFADAEVDRSPTGSGVTARMAMLHARGEVQADETRQFESITGSIFSARIASRTRVGDKPAVTVAVTGRAHYSGKAEYWLEDGDTLGRGFLLR